jgi:hypothetical protein
MMRLHTIIDGPGVGNPCVPCLVEHKDCTIDECERPHMYLLTDHDYAQLVRTGEPPKPDVAATPPRRPRSKSGSAS